MKVKDIIHQLKLLDPEMTGVTFNQYKEMRPITKIHRKFVPKGSRQHELKGKTVAILE